MSREDWFPWYVIGWRLLWAVPIYTIRFLFVLCVFFMHLSANMAEKAWEATA